MSTTNRAQRAIIRISRGKLRWSDAEVPALEFTKIDRGSGEQRSVLPTVLMRDGADYVVVASRGGDDEHQACFFNLRHYPAVEMMTGGMPPSP